VRSWNKFRSLTSFCMISVCCLCKDASVISVLVSSSSVICHPLTIPPGCVFSWHSFLQSSVHSHEHSFLANCMELSPSWQANSHSSSQETPRLLWKQKVHYRVQKSPPLVSVMSLMNLDYTTPLCSFIIHSNTFFPSTPTSFKWSLSFRFTDRIVLKYVLSILRGSELN